ncbi:NAD(P)H:quinone oxidoreductase, type IV, partial [Radiomyces spectabilis]|uniref:NAD(P)H:quinone oxidoreductase, type IV n=1 Tax=Radiomyces spectabilis TaxID=64574 RepID=UPI00221F463F
MNHSKPKVYIVIYSLYHHVYKLSLAVREGLVAEGIDATIFQVQETLDDNVLRRMKAPVKPDIPVIRSQQLVEPDGLIFGLPTRFGSFPAQMKALLDATGMIWANGELQGKFAGTFFSTASQHGGHESLALTAITYLAHHGMMYVPFGFASKALFSNDEVIGGSAYGAGTITNGDGSRQPSEAELNIAKYQGQQFAKIVKNYARGR